MLAAADRAEVDTLTAWRAETTRDFTLRLLRGDDLLAEFGRAVAAELELLR